MPAKLEIKKPEEASIRDFKGKVPAEFLTDQSFVLDLEGKTVTVDPCKNFTRVTELPRQGKFIIVPKEVVTQRTNAALSPITVMSHDLSNLVSVEHLEEEKNGAKVPKLVYEAPKKEGQPGKYTFKKD